MTDRERELMAVPLLRPASDPEYVDPALVVLPRIPSVPRVYVPRPRLLDLLDRASGQPLVLVSAPAGAGKTSLLADWAGRTPQPQRVAWIDVDDEPDEATFWPRLMEGLAGQGVHPAAGTTVNGSASPGQRLLASLASAVAACPARLTVVLDGYERAPADVAERLDYLLRHSGGRLQLVIGTREDSGLPLYRYRLEDAVAEIGMAELAFTDDEAGDLLSAAGVRLSPEALHTLNHRTGGWAAGLRFAALGLEAADEAEAAVASVAGGAGDIAEYLQAEVLDAQTDGVRDLLLRTSVPDTVELGLAEALAGPAAGRVLADLWRKGNVFLRTAGDGSGTYRYVPLFREFLLSKLTRESPQKLVRLERRAARWFAERGRLADAVRHAAAGKAWSEAAGLVVDDLAVGRLLLKPPDEDLVAAARGIPAQPADQSTSVVRAALALGDGDLGCCDAELGHALDGGPRGPGVTVSVALLRALRAALDDEPRRALRLGRVAQRVVAAREHRHRTQARPELEAFAHMATALALLRSGRVDEAGRELTLGCQSASAPGCESLQADCLALLALSSAVRGELVRARNQADRAVVAADRAGIAPAERPAATAVALAWVAVEEYDLQSALDHVDQARACPGLRDDPVSKALLALVEARLQRARGDLLDAIATVERAGAREDCGSWLGDQLRVEAASLRVLADGTVPELADLRGGLEPEVALVASQARRVQGEDIAAEDRLDRALAPDVPLATQVSAWLLKVGQELDHGRLDRARTALDRALGLAAKQTLRRPFREAGAPVQEMLDAHPELGRRNPWLGWEQGTPAPAIPGQRVGGSNGHGHRPEARMVEHLTAKELEVLGHLAELLSTEEVAATMFVSVNTVRTHVRNILRKLEVSRRNDAIRRARDLHLLDR